MDKTEEQLDKSYQQTMGDILNKNKEYTEAQLSEEELDRRENIIAMNLSYTYRNYLTEINAYSKDNSLSIDQMIEEVRNKKSKLPSKGRWILETFNPVFIEKMLKFGPVMNKASKKPNV